MMSPPADSESDPGPVRSDLPPLTRSAVAPGPGSEHSPPTGLLKTRKTLRTRT